LISSGIIAAGRLQHAAGVVNALLLPIVLGFLFWLGRTALPQALRLPGAYAFVVAVAFLLISGVAVYAGVVGAWSSWRGGARGLSAAPGAAESLFCCYRYYS
jgi:hypothetical protein